MTKMGEGTARRLAWSIAGLSALLLGAGIFLSAVAMIRAGRPIGLPSHQLTVPFSGIVFAVLGGLVLSLHPRHPIAWMLAGVGLLSGIEMLNFGILTFGSLEAPGQLIPAPPVSHWLAQWIWSPRGMIPLTFLLLLFPDGRLPSRRWRVVGWAAALALIVSTLGAAFLPAAWEGLGGIVWNPFGIRSELLGRLSDVAGSVLSLAILGCFASVFVRLRRSGGMERLQMKVMGYSLGIVVGMVFLAVAGFFLIRDIRTATEIAFSIINITTIVVAVAVGIAILRYRLFDIDVIIRRTLVYGVLSVLVVATYIVVVGSLSAIFQARGSLLVSLVATGLIAVLFQPMRDRLQRAVNRLLYGRRDEPYDVLSRIGRSFEGVEAPEALFSTIVDTVSQSLKLPYVGIALPAGEGMAVVAQSGTPGGSVVSLPLMYQRRHLGSLICAPRSAEEPFTDSEGRLLRDVASQAAVAVHALTLSAALQRSRERLVSAREEERRRLRRDLHDGLGPQLAGLGLKLDAARNQLAVDPKLADAILVQLRGEVQDAIGDIRRLVYNLRPPALDELGLLQALRASAVAQLSSAGPRVVIEGPSRMPPLPAAIEVAAYRIAQEAMTNVVRHAHARHCHVRLSLKNGLELEVVDDGEGFPEAMHAGVGLTSMQERTSELGGWLRIEGTPEGGTKVVARFPLEVASS
jgi:two-component system NarL family sensor kinase